MKVYYVILQWRKMTRLDPLIRKEVDLFAFIYSIYKADITHFTGKYFFITGKGLLSEAK